MPIFPADFKLRNYVIALLTLLLVLLNVIALVLYRKGDDLDAADRWVRHTHEVIGASLDLNDSLQAAIIAQRGYLLTRRNSFLETLHRELDSLAGRQRELARQVADSPVQMRRLEAIDEALEAKRAHLLEQVERRRAAFGQGPLGIEEQQEGLRLLLNYRQLHREFLAEEQRLLRTRIAQRERQADNFFNSFLLSALLGILVLVAANAFIYYAAARQRRIESDLRETRAALDETTERLQLALQGTSDGVFDWSVPGDSIYISPRYAAMLGYREEELPRGMWALKETLLHPDDLEPTVSQLRAYVEGELPEYRVTYRMRHRSGAWLWVLSRAIGLFGEDGRAYRLVGAHTDITELKTLEENLLASNRELEGFTYIASHDLRSPLVNLKGFAGELQRATELLAPFVLSALEKKPPPPNAAELRYAVEEDIPEALRFIRSSVERMDRLTSAILQLSRIGRRALQPERLNMNELVRRCLASLGHAINEKGVQVEIRPLPDAWADAVAMEQIVGNLLDNAIKYLDPSRPGRIVVGGSEEGAFNRYFVEDNGRGIRETDRQKVFEIFRRAGNNEAIPGEGMGMPYVRAMLRRHGGDIDFTSAPGTGTTFVFTLPHEPKENPDA